jgi:hypothetical protein
MAFSQDDLNSLADDFRSAPDYDIRTPRAYERVTGGQAGFSHYERAPEKSPEALPVRKCRRCRFNAEPGRSMCLRHADAHRREQVERARRRGGGEWTPGGKGRPPNIARRKADVETQLQRAMLADALAERAALDKRIARMRGELTLALKRARNTER